jgi:hypothetical protein
MKRAIHGLPAKAAPWMPSVTSPVLVRSRILSEIEALSRRSVRSTGHPMRAAMAAVESGWPASISISPSLTVQ